MLQSMTGFGKAEREFPAMKITVQIKSLNSKQFDANVKIPANLRGKEIAIRNLLSENLVRGKIEIIIAGEGEETEKPNVINKQIAKNYFSELKALAAELNYDVHQENMLQTIMRFPDTLQTTTQEVSDEIWLSIRQVIEEAVEELHKFRKQEGKVLTNDILLRIEKIKKLLAEVSMYEKRRIEKIKQRIAKNLDEYFDEIEIDKNRFEQELVYYIERLDITEEKVRLENHCHYFVESLECEETVGKKLNFIAQEILREINTIGSKANDSDIQKLVVQMKDEIEKIKEQVMNVL